MFKYILYKFGQFCVHHLPVWISYRLAVGVSDLQYIFSPRDRRAVTNNLKIILNSKGDISREVREVFRNFGRYLLEFFRMDKFMDQKFIAEHITIKNPEYLQKALEGKKGGIILTAHIGNWELGGMAISMLGYPIIAVALPHKERPVNDLFNSQREARGIKVIQTNGAIRKCIEALHQNKLVALLADRDFGMHGEAMEFFGRKTLIPKGPAVFSIKTGAPLIPAILVREADDRFLLTIDKPIYPPAHGDEQTMMLDLMKTFTKIIESKIKQYPTQWLMFREFWIK